MKNDKVPRRVETQRNLTDRRYKKKVERVSSKQKRDSSMEKQPTYSGLICQSILRNCEPDQFPRGQQLLPRPLAMNTNDCCRNGSDDENRSLTILAVSVKNSEIHRAPRNVR